MNTTKLIRLTFRFSIERADKCKDAWTSFAAIGLGADAGKLYISTTLPPSMRVQGIFCWSLLEALFALFHEEVEVGFRDIVEYRKITSRLVPIVLDLAYVLSVDHKSLRVVDAMVMELGNVEDVVRAEVGGVGCVITQNKLVHNSELSLGLGIGDHGSMYLTATRIEAENRQFPCCPSPTFPLALAPKVALVDFNFSINEGTSSAKRSAIIWRDLWL